MINFQFIFFSDIWTYPFKHGFNYLLHIVVYHIFISFNKIILNFHYDLILPMDCLDIYCLIPKHLVAF